MLQGEEKERKDGISAVNGEDTSDSLKYDDGDVEDEVHRMKLRSWSKSTWWIDCWRRSGCRV